MLICVNCCVRKREFSVKVLQVLEACTHSQHEIFFSCVQAIQWARLQVEKKKALKTAKEVM